MGCDIHGVVERRVDGKWIVPKLRGNIKRALASVDGATLYCLGYTKDRSPRHPLMLAYTTPLESYKP